MATILVVDDAAICREPIAASLRLAGFKTLCAGNGQEALWVLQQAPVDLVLLDIAMPVMDGLTALKKIREDRKLMALPVILLTAVTDQAHREQAAMLRPADYLLKSHFSLHELLARVRKHLPAAAA
jgi:two-component system alkaline phosphatase synthesis response regulator PhoP